MARNQGAVAHLEKIRGTNTADERMPVSGSDVSTARNNSVTVCGFSYFDAANAIETLGEGCRETFGHVLDGNDSGTIPGHRGEHLKQGFRAAGGRPDGNYFLPLVSGSRENGGRNHHIGGAMVRDLNRVLAKLVHPGRGGRTHGVFQ